MTTFRHGDYSELLMIISPENLAQMWPMLSDEDKAHTRRRVSLMY